VNNVTVITGASGGIGEELAYCAAKAGRKLVLVARSADKMKAVAEKIVALGAPAPEIVALDLGNPASGEALANALKQKNLKVFELINNAGYGLAGRFEELDAADQIGMVDLNMRALTDLTRRFLPEIIEAQGRRDERRVDRGVPAGAEHGDLLREQGLCAVVLRGDLVRASSGRVRVSRAFVRGLCRPALRRRASKSQAICVLMKFSHDQCRISSPRAAGSVFSADSGSWCPVVLNEISATLAPLTPKALVLWLASPRFRAEKSSHAASASVETARRVPCDRLGAHADDEKDSHDPASGALDPRPGGPAAGRARLRARHPQAPASARRIALETHAKIMPAR
jgi:NAD(P)-dependent dehydrogenase (short-subunit alcohol dehydrogenase family)